MATAPGGGARHLRRDAEANRCRIMEAASALMAERGLSVPLEDIAAAAEVGIGTLYRRFPTREALIEAIFEQRFESFAAELEASLELEDGWETLVYFLRATTAKRIADRGLSELLDHDTVTGQVRQVRERLAPVLERIVERARACGRVRPDLEVGDLVMLQHMLVSVGMVSAPLGPEFWERYLDLVLDGLVVARKGTARLRSPAPSVEQLEALFSQGILACAKRAPGSAG
jgi:AcrR family transcriptional regulator